LPRRHSDNAATSEIGQPKRVVQFAVGQQAGVAGDAAAVEFQPQATVEIEPQRSVIRFTRRVFHERATMIETTS
jgi:hypothetical protein